MIDQRFPLGVGEAVDGRALCIIELGTDRLFPGGDKGLRILDVALEIVRIPVDREQELVDVVLAHAACSFGYQVK
jgi:hypothetical protein